MTTERWRQTEEIYQTAADLDPCQRRVFLSQSCGTDPELRKAIEDLLAADKNFDRAIETAISDEARAKFHEFQRKGKRNIYQGLTFWTPNINLFRDPRWGRGMETYGEDPYLTSRLAVAFIKGLQGDDPKYLKTVATAKHYAVHSGPEPLRQAILRAVCRCSSPNSFAARRAARR